MGLGTTLPYYLPSQFSRAELGWPCRLGEHARGQHAHSQRTSCPRRWHGLSRCPPLKGRGLLGSREPFISLGS